MFLKSIKLKNFRNFTDLNVDFTPITLLVGKNAQGKSNLLEAVYFLATSKSPRAEKDAQLINEKADFLMVEAQVESQDVTKLEIAMQLHENGINGGARLGLEKKTRVNGIPRRTLDYIGNLTVIHFSPEDINLVTGPPSLRRWHIDLTLAQVDRDYKKALTSYHEALSAKNRLLKRIKDGLSKTSELEFWTDTLVKNGMIVQNTRRAFFQSLNKEIDLLSKQIELSCLLDLLYLENNISYDRAREYLAREVAAAATLIGPHRDDFIFKWGNKDLAYFGSRGEQRVAVLQLKLAELKFVQNSKEIIPVLLLDDVFSELDETYRAYVIEVMGNQQTILSAVETDQLPDKFLKSAKVIKVDKGKLLS